MILFLSFAPIEFKGGAERWLKEVTERTSAHEDTYLITVSSKVSDIYGQIVLNRKFSDHVEKVEFKKVKYISLTWEHLNPLSSKHAEVKKIFQQARLIYAKSEFMEFIIDIYFGGLKALKKTIGGVHSPIFYNKPKTFLNHFHNFTYTSFVYKLLLSKLKKIHVLNKRDELFLTSTMGIRNVKQIYDGVNIPKIKKIEKPKNTSILKIITVGELSIRKGTDILCSIISIAPNNFFFSIIGDGPFKNDVITLTKKFNCKYYGYIDNSKKIEEIYAEHDVLLFPSRAETLGLVMPEAMNYGLKIVNSNEVMLNMPKYIESSSPTEDPKEYINLLQKVFEEKEQEKIKKQDIHKYAYEEFSNDVLHPLFMKEILDMR